VQDANGRHVDVVDADGYERRPTQDQSGATFVESVR
jgi:hypothetical protein